jgi:ribose transport system substrate-binding protein
MRRVSWLLVRSLFVCILVGSTLTGLGGSARAHTAAATSYKIGFANGLIGNGWREEMICSAKLQASTSSVPVSVNVQENQQNTALMISQIRNLISQGVNAIIIDPPDPTALNSVIHQATQKGIKVVVVDQLVTSPDAYQIVTDPVAYGRLGMQWLATQLGGKGNIVLLRGAAGSPGDTDAHSGVEQVLAKYPGIKVVGSAYTNWNSTTALKAMSDLLTSNLKIDGVWTDDIDYSAVSAFKNAGKPFVPITGGDTNAFVQQLVNYKSQGLVGAVVTNPSTIGGAAVTLALKLLNGKTEPKITKLTSQVWDNVHNLPQIKSVEFLNRGATFTVEWQIPGWTTYTKNQFLNSCK